MVSLSSFFKVKHSVENKMHSSKICIKFEQLRPNLILQLQLLHTYIVHVPLTLMYEMSDERIMPIDLLYINH